MVEVNECDFIEQVNATKYLKIDRLFLLRDFNPDFEQAEIDFYITVRGHLDYNYCGVVGNDIFVFLYWCQFDNHFLGAKLGFKCLANCPFGSNVETGLLTSQTCHQHKLSPISVTIIDVIFTL